MFQTLIRFSIQFRHAVLLCTLLLAVFAAFSYRWLVIDAVPDITNIQVQVNTEAPGYTPLEVEQRVTRTIELLMLGIPGLDYSRSLSRYGLSQVTLVFEDGTDIYHARQLVSQRLIQSAGKLPEHIAPTLGPIATGLGEIFMYTIESQDEASFTLRDIRELQDWVIKPQLQTIPGVVEINSIGGAARQIVVEPNLEKLRAYGLSLDDLSTSISLNNENRGAGFIERNGEQLLIRVPAQVKRFESLLQIIVGVHEGIPISLEDVAEVHAGAELRNGAALENGREVVLGTVFMLMGENGRIVAQRVEERVKEIIRTLPEGVEIKVVYNRSHLIDDTIQTVRNNLVEGALLVIVILFFALGNIRAALITACVIPISMLITIYGMVESGMSANLMSLGALDFGLIVDGAVILVENCIHRLGEAQKVKGRTLSQDERLQIIYEASLEVRQATLFGELIIMVVYIPILTLTGIEGKMYQPMAFTVLLALAAAFVLSLTFVPAAVATFVSGKVRERNRYIALFQDIYTQLLRRCLYARSVVLGGAALLLFVSIGVFRTLGTEFVPSLDEGDIALHALRIPGTSLSQAVEMQKLLEREVRDIPEVKYVFSKIGTAEIATDPMPPNVADGFVILKPRHEWPDPYKPKEAVVSDVEKKVSNLPGNNYEFTQPIEMRFNELIAGVRSDVAVKIYGEDMSVLLEQAESVKSIIFKIQGASDVRVEQVTGLPVIHIEPDRERLGRLGLTAADIQNLMTIAYAGQEVSTFYKGDRSFPVVVRLEESVRVDIDSLRNIPIPLPVEAGLHPHREIGPVRSPLRFDDEQQRPFTTLSDVADVNQIVGPNQISRENGRRRVVVTANVRGQDLGTFVEQAQERLGSDLDLPSDYWIRWGGQYEHLLSARSRLLVIVPLVLFSVFTILFLTFRSLRYSLLVFTGVPFALTGGVLSLWIRGIPFSISAAVGFIALSGVSVLNALVLVSFVRKNQISEADPLEAILHGATARLRPVVMTALVASLGFLPMALSQGTGSEVQRPLATVVIGGIVSSTILTLFVLPILLYIFRGKPMKE